MERKKYYSGTEWEKKVSYSRAIKIGNVIEVAGTVSTDGSNIQFKDDPFKQTEFILQKISDTLAHFGANKSDIVRTRMFVTDISKWEEIGKAHGAFFNDIDPVTTMVEVSKLIDDEYLIEIEATAIVV